MPDRSPLNSAANVRFKGPVTFSYVAQIEPTPQNDGRDFDSVWKECGGKYPYRVIAIDDSVNHNGWGITAERLDAFAKRMIGIQVRTDHKDEFLAIAGDVTHAAYDPKEKKVFADAWTHEYEVAKRIHYRTGKDVSMQAEATDVECGSCGANPFSACKCESPWRSLIDPNPIEISHVARGAYDNTKVTSSNNMNGFYAGLEAAINEDVKHMDEIAKLEDRLAQLEANYKALLDDNTTNPAPEQVDNAPKKKIPTTPGDADPPVVDDTEKAAEEDMKDKKIKELEAKCRAMEDKMKDSAKAARDPEPIETFTSAHSRRSQPGSAPEQNFRAARNDNPEPMTYEKFLAAREAGKDPWEGAGIAKSRNTELVKSLRQQGYNESRANLGADIFSAIRDIKAKTVIEHTDGVYTSGGGF